MNKNRKEQLALPETCQHCDTDITLADDGWVDTHTGNEFCEQMSADGPTNRRHVPAR